MTTSNTDLNWIANYIWGIADDVLRDLYVRGKYRDVILPMTVLRRLDAVLEGHQAGGARPLPRRGRPRRTRSDPRRLRGGLPAGTRRRPAVGFKGKAKAFVRTYGFLSCVLPYTKAEWGAPEEEDLSKGILNAIDMDSYRVEQRAVQKITLPDADAELEPVPTSGGGRRPELELDRLSNILKAFNDLLGDIAWQDRDRVGELITRTIPAQVAADAAFRNARRNSDDANARIEHDRVLARVVPGMVKDDAELFKHFMDNEGFKRWMTDRVFELACAQTGAP